MYEREIEFFFHEYNRTLRQYAKRRNNIKMFNKSFTNK
jgi:hypothetical protein